MGNGIDQGLYQLQGFTGFYDKNQVPIFIGDLIKIYHFTAANRRKVWMYKKVVVMEYNSVPSMMLVHISQLGLFRSNEIINKCVISSESANGLEVVEGDYYASEFDGSLTCWWERKRDFKKVLKGWEAITDG